MTRGRTIVIGLGNAILRDDGVGPQAARLLQARLGSASEVTVREMGVGGLRLVEELVGYDRAFIVDATFTGMATPGTVRQLSLESLLASKNLSCSHDTNLATAMALGREVGLALPSEIQIWGVEGENVDTFGEQLTERVAEALPWLVDQIHREITR